MPYGIAMRLHGSLSGELILARFGFCETKKESVQGNKMLNHDEYIHPDSMEIGCLINELQLEGKPLSSVPGELFRWFDNNISYSRLNAPYYPLQRSDLDVLRMKSGTCGDYSNLVVSVLTRLGYKTKYAFVNVDCYGNPQEHICAAVWSEGQWKLIDATLPYRKWHGWDCPHKECELLSYDDMKTRLKQEEKHWTDKAAEWNRESFAGLLYAPWIHEDAVVCTEDSLETVFFLLILDSAAEYNLYVYYLVYTKDDAASVIMCRVTNDGQYYRFPVNTPKDMWDDEQWGEEYTKSGIPECYHSDRLATLSERIDRIAPSVHHIVNPHKQ